MTRVMLKKCILTIWGCLLLALDHLIRESDPEHGWEVGTEVSNDRCVAAFNEDIETVVSDCHKLYPDFEDLPEEVKRIIANMMFNMGFDQDYLNLKV